MSKKAKTKKGTLAIGFCLDESGSMNTVRTQTIDGVNEYLGSLRNDGGKTTLSLTMFSSDRVGLTQARLEGSYRPFTTAADIKAVPELSTLTYRPDGNTPLFDAIGYTIHALEAELTGDELGQTLTQPDAVLFVIQTDGAENASREYSRQAIVDLITRKELEGWKFVFLGANMDEAAAARTSQFFGMSANTSMAYDYAQTDSAFEGVSVASSTLRSSPGMSSAQVTNTARSSRDKAEERKKDKAKK